MNKGSFRRIPQVPAVGEILGPDPQLPEPAIVDEPYRDVEHYLSTHYNLLREDFLGPLREGIRAYLDKTSYMPNGNMHVYPKSRIFSYNSKHAYHVIKFWCPRHWLIDWKQDQRFMSGSLLCITRDNFETTVLATVAMTRPNFLRRGLVGVTFESAFEVKEYLNSEFVLIEAPVYFDMYRNVLTSLLKFNEVNMPLSEYVTGKNTTARMPGYLKNAKNAAYKVKEYISGPIVPSTYTVSVEDQHSWPSAIQLGLDDSQLRALKNALTNNLTVIQGPPGTGKTFVGLRIIQTLIDNSRYWRSKKGQGPILVVTYTNHALDQFLEGVCKFTDKIVRIGGGCESAVVEKFKMSRQVFKSHNAYFESARQDVADTLKEIIVLEQIIDTMANGSVVNQGTLLAYGIISSDVFNLIVSAGGMRKWLHLDDNDLLMDVEMVGAPPIDSFDDVGIVTELLESMMNLEPPEEVKKEKIRREDEDWLLGNAPSAELNSCSKESGAHFAFCTEEIDCQIAPIVQELSIGTTWASRLEEELGILEAKKKQIATLVLQVVNQSDVEGLGLPETLKTLEIADRWALYSLWHNILLENLTVERSDLEFDYKDAAQKVRELEVTYSQELCKDSLVVGMTTSGAAKYHALLCHLQSKIVVVEEAAKVLEAHIISSLTDKCEQLIMIGDHKQLRPFVSNHRLVDANLGVSFFERLVKLGMSPCVLEVQHRMSPAIAQLVTPAVYPVLRNHPKVLQYPKVRGMLKDMFFFDRQSEEMRERSTASKLNVEEALIALELARYLLNQGYARKNITIITTYNGQLRYLEKIVSQDPRYSALTSIDASIPPLAIRTVDEYQGEENDVIILSLVRSNLKNIVGFLDDEHRITVAMSRARHGLFVLGDAELLRVSGGSLWKKVLAVFERNDAIGGSLALRCDKHWQAVRVSSFDDFVNLPGNGCPAKCLAFLACGHQCQNLCHLTDLDHRGYICKEETSRQRCIIEKHISTGPCFDNRCTFPVKKMFPCQHSAFVACHETELFISCPRKIFVVCKVCGSGKPLPCGTKSTSAPCPNIVSRVLACGHTLSSPCSTPTSSLKCENVCGKRLACGHGVCSATCHKGDCSVTFKCMELCNRVTCSSHKISCHKLCYQKCAPCEAKMTYTFETCKHVIAGKCCDVKGKSCGVKVKVERPGCGHTADVTCSEKKISKMKCLTVVECELNSPCGHPLKLPCGDRLTAKALSEEQLFVLMFQCTAKCNSTLPCGHICEGTCKGCVASRIHLPCKKPCSRVLVCGHKCNGLCGEMCAPCNKACSFKCTHGRCRGVCSETNHGCTEPCTNKCEHRSCPLSCWEPCKIPACNNPCKKRLSCLHPCPGLCGEPCPRFCSVCSPTEFCKVRTSHALESVQIGERKVFHKRLYQLSPCGHAFHVGKLDQYYSSRRAITPLSCPACGKSINSQNQRYLPILHRNHEIAHEVFDIACSRMPFKLSDVEAILDEVDGGKNTKKNLQIGHHPLISANATAIRNRLTPVYVSGRQFVRPLAYQDKFTVHFSADVLREIYLLLSMPQAKSSDTKLLKLLERLNSSDYLSPQECMDIQIFLDDLKIELVYSSSQAQQKTYKIQSKNGSGLAQNQRMLVKYLKKDRKMSDEVILAAINVNKCLSLGFGRILEESRLYEYHPVFPEQGKWQLCPKLVHIVYVPTLVSDSLESCAECAS